MATNPKFVNYRLTDAELYKIASSFFGVAESKGSPSVVAFALVRAESDGITNAYRPASANPLGGDDRGIWQFNSKAHPDVTDAEAYDAFRAFARARDKSTNGTNWGAWDYGPNAYSGTPRRLDVDTAYRTISALGDLPSVAAIVANIAAARSKQPGTAAPETAADPPLAARVLLDPLGTAGSAAGSALADLTDWAEPLTRVLSSLGNAEWWRRIGIGALGAVLIVAMIALYNREAITTSIVAGAVPG